jgi:cytochrome P450
MSEERRMPTPEPLMADVDFLVDEMPDMHERLASLREVGPVVPLKAFGKPAWFIIDFAEADRVFRDNKDDFDVTRFNDEIAAPIVGRTLLAMKNREHALNRGLIAPSFMPGQVRSYAERFIESTIHEMLDDIEDQEEVDLKTAFCEPLPFLIITKLLGLPVDEARELIALTERMSKYFFQPEISLEARRGFDDYIRPIMLERRRNPGPDLISQLVHSELEGEKLDDEDILTFIRTIYPAGGHTTSLNLPSATYAALADPDIRAMVMAGEKERQAVVQEALRWEPALGILPRLLLRDAEIGGASIDRDQAVYVSVTAANNDPKMFPDPRRFDPTRKNLANLITFGRHEHMCLGRHLAASEMEKALQILFERFPDMELVQDREVIFSGSMFRTCNALMVRMNGQ